VIGPCIIAGVVDEVGVVVESAEVMSSSSVLGFSSSGMVLVFSFSLRSLGSVVVSYYSTGKASN
jgi:hypothetical protein